MDNFLPDTLGSSIKKVLWPFDSKSRTFSFMESVFHRGQKNILGTIRLNIGNDNSISTEQSLEAINDFYDCLTYCDVMTVKVKNYNTKYVPAITKLTLDQLPKGRTRLLKYDSGNPFRRNVQLLDEGRTVYSKRICMDPSMKGSFYWYSRRSIIDCLNYTLPNNKCVLFDQVYQQQNTLSASKIRLMNEHVRKFSTNSKGFLLTKKQDS
jgi:hypothetical protein